MKNVNIDLGLYMSFKFDGTIDTINSINESQAGLAATLANRNNCSLHMEITGEEGKLAIVRGDLTEIGMPFSYDFSTKKITFISELTEGQAALIAKSASTNGCTITATISAN